MDDRIRMGDGPIGLGIVQEEGWELLDEMIGRFCELVNETESPVTALARTKTLYVLSLQQVALRQREQLAEHGMSPEDFSEAHALIMALSALIDLKAAAGGIEQL